MQGCIVCCQKSHLNSFVIDVSSTVIKCSSNDRLCISTGHSAQHDMLYAMLGFLSIYGTDDLGPAVVFAAPHLGFHSIPAQSAYKITSVVRQHDSFPAVLLPMTTCPSTSINLIKWCSRCNSSTPKARSQSWSYDNPCLAAIRTSPSINPKCIYSLMRRNPSLQMVGVGLIRLRAFF